MTTDPQSEYARLVWDKFLELSGLPETRSISHKEYILLARWMSHYPVRYVLTAMDQAQPATPPKTLWYFERIVAAEAKRAERTLGA